VILDLLLAAQLLAAGTPAGAAEEMSFGAAVDVADEGPRAAPAGSGGDEEADGRDGEPPEPRRPVFGEEIVVAERRPAATGSSAAAVSTLDGADLARLPAPSLAEAVALLPGFQVLFASPFGGLPMEVARGFFGGGDAGYVQLRVDGVPLADAETGAADWGAVAAPEVARVEALRGTASPLYGDTAFGGVVEVITRRAGEGPRWAAGASGGSFGTAAGDLRWTRPGDRLAAAASLDARRTGGFRDHDASRRLGARLRLDGGNGDGDGGGNGGGAATAWSLSLAAARHRREEPGPLSFAEIAADRGASSPLFRHDRDDEERWTAAASWRRSAPVALAVRAWHDERESDAIRTLLLAAGFGDRAGRRLDAATTGASFQAAGALGRAADAGGAAKRNGRTAGRADGPGDGPGAGSADDPAAGRHPAWSGDWALGLDLAREDLASRWRAVDDAGRRGAPLAAARGERRRAGAFAGLGWDAAARLRLVAGARWDAIDDRFPGARRREAWSPRAGAVLRLAADRPWTAFAQWSRAFKAPTLDQLFDPRPLPDGAGGTFTLANPELVPQRAATVEAGLREVGPGGRWRLAAYRTAVEDEIDFDPATFRYVNLGATLHRGVEAGGELWRGRRGRVEIGWEWNEVFPRQGPNEGRQLKNVPQHTGRLLAFLRLPAEVDLGLSVRHLAGRHLDDAHRFRLPDATLVDLRLARRLGPLELRLDVFDLLDDDVLWVGYALPSFAGGEVPYAFPGHPRAATLGVRWASGS
jgi:outer membrane receptor protein involved in Fe transport